MAERRKRHYTPFEHKHKSRKTKKKAYVVMGAKQAIAVELSAVIVGVRAGKPTVRVDKGRALPSGPLETEHKTLQQAVRALVAAHGKIDLGYIEQLYTFADKYRTAHGQRIVSIGYLALEASAANAKDAVDIYAFFPWEDRKNDAFEPLLKTILKHLCVWKKGAQTAALSRAREERIAVTFPSDARSWNEELVLQRYELLWEAGLLEETGKRALLPGLAMKHDHRRILATALARLRAKIKYRPVVFELLSERFTLLELQETVEALAGVRVHKQNFRRLVLTQGLVAQTGAFSRPSQGRPAKLFAFRQNVLRERAVVGTKLPRSQ